MVWKDWTLQRKLVSGGFGLALLLLASVGAAAYFSIAKLTDDQQLVEHTYRVLDTIYATADGMKDVERGRRGYLLTRDASYLTLCEQGQQQAVTTLRSLRQLTRDNPSQQQRITQLEPLITQKLRIVQRSIVDLKQVAMDQALQLQLTEQGSQLQQTIQRLLLEISQVERVLLEQRLQDTRSSVQAAKAIVLLGSLLGLALLLGVYSLLRREISRRIQAEATLQQINDELEHRVSQRTADLTQANDWLNAEIAEREQAQAQLQQAKAELEQRVQERTQELLQTNQQLQTSETKFRSLAETIEEVFWISDPQARQLVYVSPAYSSIWGRSITALYENFQEWMQAIHPDDRERVEQSFAQGAAQGEYDEEYRVLRPDGSVYWIHDRGFPVSSEGNQLHWVAGIAEDITSRKQAEAALRDSEERFRSAFDNAPIGIALVGLTGKWLKVNPALCDILGYTEAELLTKTFQDITHPDDLDIDLSYMDQLLAGEIRSYTLKKRYVDRWGHIIWILLDASLIRDAQGEPKYFLSQIQDITERQAIEQMKNEFISVVSHELRTPLTSIRGSLGLLAAGVYDNKPEKARRMIEIALTDSERLCRLVNDILDLERLESGRITLVKESCDLETLLQRSAEAMQASADVAQVTLNVLPIAADTQVWVAADAIIQTLTNLLSNAIKFSPPNSTITIGTEPYPDWVTVSVHDQGRGIPSDKLESIFGRFQQVEAADAGQKGGTGLGLAICKTIIQQHGGRIWVDSEVGSGSTFYFTLPRRELPSLKPVT
ncbi:PAS domain S-box protein [Pantanalinema rosaneae CENA516]|uniref:PAS domain S-box protein n=1 Tax=Pantanalinema rosaneae TaxID=1620701 RepID=UPI003D6F410E